jgi:hypothetical protein
MNGMVMGDASSSSCFQEKKYLHTKILTSRTEAIPVKDIGMEV